MLKLEETSLFNDDSKRLFVVSINDVIQSSTSKGNQQKWFTEECYVKSRFYGEKRYWKDDAVEVAASDLCAQLGISAVRQNLCDIQLTKDVQVDKRVPGSYSHNFLKDTEEFITFFRLYQASPELSWGPIAEAEVRILQTIKIYKQMTKLSEEEIIKYLSDMVKIDFLIGNEDRHLNNFGVIRDMETGQFRTAPLFDFGLSMFEHDSCYDGVNLDSAIAKMMCRPFSLHFDDQLEIAKEVMGFDLGGKIDISKIVFPNELSKEYVKYAAGILHMKVTE